MILSVKIARAAALTLCLTASDSIAQSITAERWIEMRGDLWEQVESLSVEFNYVGEPLAAGDFVAERMGFSQAVEQQVTSAFKGEKRLQTSLSSHDATLNDPKRPVVSENAPEWIQKEQVKMQQQYDAVMASQAEIDKIVRDKKPRRAEKQKKEEVVAFNGLDVRVFDGVNGHVSPAASLSSQSLANFYRDWTGLPKAEPSKGRESPVSIVAPNLASLLAKGENLTIDTEADNLGPVLKGFFSMEHLGQPGRGLAFHITLDPNLNYAVKAVAVLDKNEKVVACRTVFDDFQEVVDGLFLPKICTGEFFADGKPIYRGIIRVSSLEANNVDDDTFDYDFPAGTRVYDMVAGGQGKVLQYTMPANAKMLDDVVRRAMGLQEVGSNKWRFILLNISVICVLIILLIRKFKSE